MIDHLLAAAIVFLLANLALGLWRIWRGPTTADRMLSALLFGATSVAVLILMAEWQAIPALRVVALLLVMLAAIITITYAGISRASRSSGGSEGRSS
ncbi:MAG: monovalent cation/H+ antiporter complex subunit F [Wenzhouxiangella sp.]